MQSASLAERLYGKGPTWKPPELKDGKFQTQADYDTWKTTLLTNGVRQAGATEVTPAGPNYNAEQMANSRAAANWGEANGFYKPPPGESGGLLKNFFDTAIAFGKDVILSPPVLAAATAGIGAALGAGTGVAADAGAEGIAAGQAAGLTTDQLLAQSAAGLSVAGPAETAAALGAGTEVAAGAAGAGAGAQFGGTTQSAAGDAGATGGGSKGAAAYLSTAKDVAGLALTGLGLAAATGAVGSTSAAPPAPTAPPQDQQGPSSQDVQNADANDQRFPNLGGSGDDTLFNGASGIDPFMLNLGRAKLLGQ